MCRWLLCSSIASFLFVCFLKKETYLAQLYYSTDHIFQFEANQNSHQMDFKIDFFKIAIVNRLIFTPAR